MRLHLTYILLFTLMVVLHFCPFGASVECNTVFYVVATLLMLSVTVNSKSSSVITFDIAFLYLFYLLYSSLISTKTYSILNGSFMFFCWWAFLGLRKIFRQQSIRENVLWFIVCGAYIEIVIGFLQLFGVIGNGYSEFRFGGSFGNPGMCAGYFSVITPIVLSRILNSQEDNEYSRYALLLCFILMLYFVVISYSRGAWIATTLGIAYIIEKHYKCIKKIKSESALIRNEYVVICSSIILVIAMSSALYYIKKDSADGRLLIWKVALTTPHSNPLWGDGVGSFEVEYGKWQRDYFASGKGSEHERYIADYVTCAYNEFIETYIEQGIVGVLLLLGILSMSLFRKPSCHSCHYEGAKAALIAYIVLCMVSFPSHSQVMYLLCVVVIAIIQSHYNYKQIESEGLVHKISFVSFPVIILILSVFPLLQGQKRMSEGFQKAVYGDYCGAVKKYEEAYPLLQNNGTFLQYYGSALALSGDTLKSIKLLEQAYMKSSDPNIPLLLGDIHQKREDTSKACISYLNAINSIPSRLYPKYQMVNLLRKTGKDAEAHKWANEILHTPVKVPTMAAREIRSEMYEYLKKR